MKNLKKFFNPKSIAIVGASPKSGKLGNILLKNIQESDWKGKLYFVNPKYSRKKNEYKANLSEIGKPVDLVLIAVPAPLVNQILLEGARAKPKIENYVVISAGFSEAGKTGKKLEENLEIIAKKNGLNVLGPNCLGFINPSRKLNASFTSGDFNPGKIAIISQSGALAVALLDWAQNFSVGFSKAISIGNKAVLDESDILEYLSSDRKTQAAALYLEDIKNGAKFAQICKKTANQKPLIVIKAGKNKAGQKAISSHTGSLAQDEAVLEAIFEKLNIIEAKTEEEFQNLVLFFNSGEIPGRREVVVLTNAGGPGVLAADFVGKLKHLKFFEIPPRAKSKLKKYLPTSASVENPIDIIGDAAPERYENVLKIISKKFPQNPLLVVLTPQSQTQPEIVARMLEKYKGKFSCVAAVFMGGRKVEKANSYLRQNGIAAFENPEEALAAIEKMVNYNTQKRRKSAAPKPKAVRLKLKANKIIQSAIREKREMLFWRETENIFREYKIALAHSQSFKNPKDIKFKKIKFPCALKTDDPKIAHRLDKKAVKLNLKSAKELKTAWRQMKKLTGSQNFLLQAMARPGLELIIGMKRDPNFGPVVVVGSGGKFTEILKDWVILIPPFSEKDASEKFRELQIFPILKGYRGEKKYQLDELSQIAVALQNIAMENPDVSQIDINPVVLYNDGSKARILDAKVFLKIGNK